MAAPYRVEEAQIHVTTIFAESLQALQEDLRLDHRYMLRGGLEGGNLTTVDSPSAPLQFPVYYFPCEAYADNWQQQPFRRALL